MTVGVAAGCAEQPALHRHEAQALTSRPQVGAFLDGALPSSAAQPAPALLSTVGAFSDLTALTPSAAWIPFGLNSPGWSDGARKSRWVAVPSPERVGFSPTAPLTWPNGTVFMKHFALGTRRLETRFLVRDNAGGYYGLAYKWRADQSDADLLTARATETVAFTADDGSAQSQTWTFPGPADCTRCHRPAVGTVLGPNARQLNGNWTYASTGITDNQLRTWNALALFDPPLVDADIPGYPKLSALTDSTATLEDRVRSYVDTNCSDCHQPSAPGPLFDARYTTALANQNLANGALKRRDLAGSPLYQRDTSLTNPMPPVGRNVVDAAAMQVVSDWVNHPFDVSGVTTGSAATRVVVTYTSPVDPASPGEYAIPGLTVSSAAASGASVTLTTSAMTPGATYTLTVNRVREAAPPKNPIWPDTRATFTFVGNRAPVTVADAFTVAEDGSLAVAAPGVLGNDTDPDLDPLVAQPVSGPARGTLVLSPSGAFTYTPAPGFSGSDAFVYRVSDGVLAGANVTVALTVTAVNDAPVATAQTLGTPEDTALAITLSGTDVDSTALTFAVVAPPARGTLTGVPPNLVYTPHRNVHGADAFTFVARDGALESMGAVVTIAVGPVNDAPVVGTRWLTVSEDQPALIALTATDVDSTALSFAVLTPPAHGTLSGTPPNLVYTPAANYTGGDAFTYEANDGTLGSGAATVVIAVNRTNDLPVPHSQHLRAHVGKPLPVTLTASDADGDTLTFSIAAQPAHGTLSGTPPALVYTPDPKFKGDDAFTFRVSDGKARTGVARVTISVRLTEGAPETAKR